MALTASRKQRLRTLENQIRKNAEAIQKNGLQIGRDLIEIRDQELWVEEYESWNQYLKDMANELVGKSFSQSANLIKAAEISKKLPGQISPDVKTNLNASHLSELGRLAPTSGKQGERGAEKDYSRLRKQDVARVLKKAVEIADSETPSVRDIRKAVDHDLGIDRSEKAKEAKRQREDNGVDLRAYIDGKIGTIEGILEVLQPIPEDAWLLLIEDNPQLVKRLTTACTSLAAFLRKVE